jgi:hypothetical protein
MYTSVHTSLVSKITRLYLLSGLPTTLVDIWTFVCTHETHDNPPTEAPKPASRTKIAFSHHLQHVMVVVVLETSLSILYALTPCHPKTFYFQLLTVLRFIPPQVSGIFSRYSSRHLPQCVEGIQKNFAVREWSTDLLSFYGETITFLGGLFSEE